MLELGREREGVWEDQLPRCGQIKGKASLRGLGGRRRQDPLISCQARRYQGLSRSWENCLKNRETMTGHGKKLIAERIASLINQTSVSHGQGTRTLRSMVSNTLLAPYTPQKVSHVPPKQTSKSGPVQIPFLTVQNIGILLQLLIEFLLDLFQHVSLNKQMLFI